MINMGLTHEYKAELWRRADEAGMCLTHYMLWAIEEAHRGGAEPVPLEADPRDATHVEGPGPIEAPEFEVDGDGVYRNLLVAGAGNELRDIQGRQAAERRRLGRRVA